MAAVKLTAQDKKDLDKFTKFLALKAAQIIVQSRLGEKVQTICTPLSSGTDWFNLAIKDIPEVLSEAKKAMCGEIPSVRLPLCVEISLKTVEGDSMMLETWCLSVLDQCDPSVRVTYTVYNRMGILLKSLISVTRVTPAYKLSRKQGPDSYVICYRIYMGEPQLHHLGEGFNKVRVGQLSTPVGTLHLSVAYRTKMTISPQHTGKDNSIMLKSDHFHPDLSPRHARQQQSEQSNVSLSETIKVGAFADSVRKPVTEPGLVIPDVPFSSLLTVKPEKEEKTVAEKEAVVPEKTDEETDQEIKGPSPTESRRSSCSMVSAPDDFIMVDLKTPFAGTNTNSELGAFYRECQSAPPLKSFQEQPTLAEQVNDFTKQLEVFEVNVKEYDDLLTSLCEDESK